ncbi:hypothetical protein BC828DRAFT_393342 [Blastocladiella britannica]|nr:hypothetical protein BC828DRAFT_393342 [Blastocladiella britannica]
MNTAVATMTTSDGFRTDRDRDSDDPNLATAASFLLALASCPRGTPPTRATSPGIAEYSTASDTQPLAPVPSLSNSEDPPTTTTITSAHSNMALVESATPPPVLMISASTNRTASKCRSMPHVLPYPEHLIAMNAPIKHRGSPTVGRATASQPGWRESVPLDPMGVDALDTSTVLPHAMAASPPRPLPLPATLMPAMSLPMIAHPIPPPPPPPPVQQQQQQTKRVRKRARPVDFTDDTPAAPPPPPRLIPIDFQLQNHPYHQTQPHVQPSDHTAAAPVQLSVVAPSTSAANAGAEVPSRQPEMEPEELAELQEIAHLSGESFDQLDAREAKRIRNTLSARKSRARKAAKIDYLEARVNQLETELTRAVTLSSSLAAMLAEHGTELPPLARQALQASASVAGLALTLPSPTASSHQQQHHVQPQHQEEAASTRSSSPQSPVVHVGAAIARHPSPPPPSLAPESQYEYRATAADPLPTEQYRSYAAPPVHVERDENASMDRLPPILPRAPMYPLEGRAFVSSAPMYSLEERSLLPRMPLPPVLMPSTVPVPVPVPVPGSMLGSVTAPSPGPAPAPGRDW